VSRGRYTHLVRFSKPAATTDAAGQKDQTYTEQFTARCDVLVLSSSKAQQYEQVQTGSDVVQIRMPHNDHVAVDWRVTWDGSAWDVRTVRDPNGLRRTLEITAERFEQ
jgi:SPP1 family predicted phage head-tail adaptor